MHFRLQYDILRIKKSLLHHVLRFSYIRFKQLMNHFHLHKNLYTYEILKEYVMHKYCL